MQVRWSGKAVADLQRLRDFLGPSYQRAAARAIRAIVDTVNALTTTPRIGEPLQQFRPREVRRVLVGPYEVRYEIANSTIFVLRVWHTREQR